MKMVIVHIYTYILKEILKVFLYYKAVCFNLNKKVLKNIFTYVKQSQFTFTFFSAYVENVFRHIS